MLINLEKKKLIMNSTQNSTIPLAEIYRCTLPELRAVTKDLDDWEHNIKLIWYIGAGFSTLGYCMIVLTAAIFPSWRKSDQNRVWMHMTSAKLFWTYLFITRDFSQCMGKFMLVLLVYVGQVSFFWMFAGAWMTYKKLVTVFPENNSKFILKALSFTWLAPLPFCITRGVFEYINYPNVMYDQRAHKVKIKIAGRVLGLKKFRDFIYAIGDFVMYFPVVLVIAGCIVVYCLVLHTLCRNRQLWGQPHHKIGSAAIGLMFLFSSGVQFLFVIANRFFTYTKLDYFSAFLTTFNVFFYAIVFICGIKDTRQLWIAFLKSKLAKVKSVLV